MGTSERVRGAVTRALTHGAHPRPPRQPVDVALVYGRPSVVLQPIVSVSTGSVLAVEALARFDGAADTERLLESAHHAGHGYALEALCLQAALAVRSELPPGMLLTVNVSPNTLRHAAAIGLWPDELTGVVVEITEQDVDDAVDVAGYLTCLRERGAAIAIDDVSTGYAGLLRLAQMRPDYVKIDRQVVSGVGDSSAQAAVLEALVTLSHRLGAAVIGEGVEDLADVTALSEYDVDYAQGYAIARPDTELRPIAAAVVATCRSSRQRVLSGLTAASHAAARTRDVYAVTAALASAGHRHDIDAAIVSAAADLGVDGIGVSILASGLHLREIASTNGWLDKHLYALADYPATRDVVERGGAIEVQLDDAAADPAERALMRSLGHASLLLIAVHDGPRTIGVLEFAQHTPKRWSAQDIAHAQGLAEHLSPALRRLGVGASTTPETADEPIDAAVAS